MGRFWGVSFWGFFVLEVSHLVVVLFLSARSPQPPFPWPVPRFFTSILQGPEVMDGRAYDYRCDIFAYAGFCYEVTHGCYPFSKEVWPT